MFYTKIRMRMLRTSRTGNFKGKICLLRTDYNIENTDETFRIEASLPTLKLLKQRNATVIVVSHRGRPKPRAGISKPAVRVPMAYSLRAALPYLKRKLGTAITFIPHFDFARIRKTIETTPAGSVFLLENIRLLSGEIKNDPKLGKLLASIADIYVNDAFAVCHRAHASLVQVPKHLSSYAGLRLEEELVALDRVIRKPTHPFVVLVGGAKVPEKMAVIGKLLPTADSFLVSGLVATTFLKAKKFDIGSSKWDKTMLGAARTLTKSSKIILPIDYVLHRNQILDIGPLTVKLFCSEIEQAKTILWSGPVGKFENERFRRGSDAIAHAIAESRAFSVAGGGETAALIRQLELEKKIGFLSTGGGAMLAYVSGQAMPGLKALR
jgi:phosphoglycerate kinase